MEGHRVRRQRRAADGYEGIRDGAEVGGEVLRDRFLDEGFCHVSQALDKVVFAFDGVTVFEVLTRVVGHPHLAVLVLPRQHLEREVYRSFGIGREQGLHRPPPAEDRQLTWTYLSTLCCRECLE